MTRPRHRPGLLAGLLVFLALAGAAWAQGDNDAFLEACWKGDRARVAAFLAQGGEVNTPGKDGYTALHNAVLGEHPEIVGLLLDRGADIEARFQGGNAALHYAVEKGNRAITELLLDRGALVNAPGTRDRTPLHAAVGLYLDPALEFTTLLLDRGANPNARDAEGWAPLHGAVTHRRGRTDLMDLLLAGGAEVEPKDKRDRTPLFFAAQHGDGTKVAALLTRGADARARDNEGNTPLHLAASPAGSEATPGMKDVITALLDAGAEVNARNAAGKIPLHDAQNYLPKDAVEVLLARGADIAPRWPLRDAARAGDRARVQALLAAGTDSNTRDDYGRTALHEAVKAGHTDVVRLLLYRGADVNIRDSSKSTPLFDAAEAGDQVIVKLLFNRGAEVNLRANDNRAGNTPLHEAACARQDARGMVELLLAKGAAINVRNDYGETPLDYAMFRDNRDAARLLLAWSVDRTLPGAADVALQQGIAAANAGDFPEAVRHFDSARRLAPDCPLPRLYLGQAEARIRGRELRAICWFRAYLAAVPRASERRAIMAEIAALQDRSTGLLHDLLAALTAAADALPAPGDHEAANPDGPARDNALATVAVLWARVGDEEKALERAGLVTNAFVRSFAESRIAEGIAATGDMSAGRRIAAQAVGTAASSPRRDRRDTAFARAAIALTNLGDTAGAQAVTARIEDARQRCQAQVMMARALANAGDTAGAVAAAEHIPVAFYRASAQAAIARAAAEAGDQPAATRALQQARRSLEQVTRSTDDFYAVPVHFVAAVAMAVDHLGRTIYPPAPSSRSVAQVEAEAFDLKEIKRDCFIAEGLLGDFDRDDAWKYRLAWNLSPLREIGLARARRGDTRGTADVFGYLGERGPWSEETTRDWGHEVNAALAGILALRGDDVGAMHRLRLARASAEKIEDDGRRATALQTIAVAANGWIAANDGLLNDAPFLSLSVYLRTLPRDYAKSAFDALADTTLALADAQRAVATIRPRPVQP